MNDIYLWPDGTWCFGDELNAMTHMSDDYVWLAYDSPEYHKFALKENING